MSTDPLASNFKGLAHVAVFTKDFTATLAFYTEVLRFKKVYETALDSGDLGWTKYALIALGSCVVEVLEPEHKDKVSENIRGSFDHLAIDVVNLDAIVEDLKQKKVKFNSDVFTIPHLLNGIKGVFIAGPNGEWIELFENTGKFTYEA